MNWALLFLGFAINAIGRARKVAASPLTPINSIWPLLWRWRITLLVRACVVGTVYTLLRYAPSIVGAAFGQPNLKLPEQLFSGMAMVVTHIPFGFFFDSVFERWLENHPQWRADVPRYNGATVAIPSYQEPTK